ncbi:MAG: cytoplasmic protein [candidate division Zixibacteria bacterium HGW-Zixibacteria-1]|nr:MAG: cytoplasmic protein [candidate division Zixibacteria bacterium HGW-Zixibacteria-1]
MERRDFLKKTANAAGLAALTGIVGFGFHNRETSSYQATMAKTKGFEVAADRSFPALALARNENHPEALRAALDAVGGVDRFIQSGDRVTIKPNVGWDRLPKHAADTNPELVAEMVRLCLAAGAAEVIVTDITCNDARRTFIRSGIKEAAENAGARVILPVEEDYVMTDLGGQLLTVWPVLKYFIETDKFINMPITKQHSLSSCTIAMKNLYGILGGRRNQLHQQIDRAIVDLAAFIRPTLTVVDATRVLMRNGPQGGSTADVRIENVVMCSTDQVAADARACEFLGLKAENVSHIVLAAQSGLGNIDYRAGGYKEIA